MRSGLKPRIPVLAGQGAHFAAALFYMIDVIRSNLLYWWRRYDFIIFVVRENRLKKINKTNVESFLAEKELTPSELPRDIIYSKVNILLAK
jgi:hypothetical protein